MEEYSTYIRETGGSYPTTETGRKKRQKEAQEVHIKFVISS